MQFRVIVNKINCNLKYKNISKLLLNDELNDN